MGTLAMGRLGLAVLAGALLLAGTACGERSEPKEATVRLYPVTVEAAGDRTLVVERAARRIAVLDPGVGEIVRALGGRVAGTPLDATGRIRFDELRRLRPDLVVASDTADERDLSRAGEVTRATVYTAPGDSIRQVERSITQLGLLTGQPIRARALVRAIETRRREAAAKLAGRLPVTVFVDTGFFTTVSDQSLIGDLIREAGGRNVAGSTPEPGPFALRDLVELDPNVYLTTSDTGLTLADLRRNRQTKKLTAVREGRFVVADVGLLTPGPRIGDGLVALARLLHPDAFR